MNHTKFAPIMLGEKGAEQFSDIELFTDNNAQDEQMEYQVYRVLPDEKIVHEEPVNAPKEEAVKQEPVVTPMIDRSGPSLGL